MVLTPPPVAYGQLLMPGWLASWLDNPVVGRLAGWMAGRLEMAKYK